MENQKPKYRSRKQVVSDCLEQGAMTETEAKALNKSIVFSSSEAARVIILNIPTLL